jgi:hypothetical protein
MFSLRIIYCTNVDLFYNFMVLRCLLNFISHISFHHSTAIVDVLLFLRDSLPDMPIVVAHGKVGLLS